MPFLMALVDSRHGIVPNYCHSATCWQEATRRPCDGTLDLNQLPKHYYARNSVVLQVAGTRASKSNRASIAWR